MCLLGTVPLAKMLDQKTELFYMDNRATDSNTVAFNVEETVPSSRANAPVWRCGEVNRTEFQVAELYSIAGHVDGSLILSCFFC